jgi:hypothetical protein
MTNTTGGLWLVARGPMIRDLVISDPFDEIQWKSACGEQCQPELPGSLFGIDYQ